MNYDKDGVMNFLKESFFEEKIFPSGKKQYKIIDILDHNDYKKPVVNQYGSIDISDCFKQNNIKQSTIKEYILETFKKVFLLDQQEEKFKNSDLNKYLKMRIDIFVSSSIPYSNNSFTLFIMADFFCFEDQEEFNQFCKIYPNTIVRKEAFFERFFGRATKIVTFDQDCLDLSLEEKLEVSSWEPYNWRAKDFPELGRIEDYTDKIGKILELESLMFPSIRRLY